jgi:3'-phosphoadenosine 5'-phosphosulfate sulfotransferase (PAPS reductase)/FAD synthetase
MVDDDRMPLNPAKPPEMKMVRFRTLGCYPLTGAIESTADTLPRDHPGDASDHHVGAPGPRDRPRPVRLHGKEEAGGLLLMRTARPDRRPTLLPTSPSRAKDLLRFITCGSVDDGKSTLIGRLLLRIQDDLRGPAGFA